MTKAAWPIALCLLACAAPRAGPFMNDERYLKAGVDPDERVDAASEAMKKRGHVELGRHGGRHFTAVGFADETGRPSAVRVVTAAGTALALDGRRAEGAEPALAVGLLPPPKGIDADADGDGFEEVFVFHRRGDGPTCVTAYRVRDVGFVDPARMALGPLPASACVTEVRDVDVDGRFELVAQWSPAPLAPGGGGRAPSVQAALFSRDHVFGHRGGPAAEAFYSRASQAATLRLLEARDAGKLDEARIVAAELGLIGYLAGGAAVALTQFDEALTVAQAQATPQDRAAAPWVQRVRAFLQSPPSTGGSPAAR